MERSIGEIFWYKGKRLIVKKSVYRCDGCEFKYHSCLANRPIIGDCDNFERKDGENVIFACMDLSDREHQDFLDGFSIDELIKHHGKTSFLKKIDTDTITNYLNGIDVETKQKEELPPNKVCYIGDFILRMNEDGTLRVTSDRGVVSIHPKADNAVEIKSTKGGK